MDRKNKLVIFGLSSFLASEWIGMLALIYLARIPEFIYLFVAFLRIFCPWLIALNLSFLAYSLISGKPSLTLATWKDFVREWIRFCVRATFISIVVGIVSATLGTLLGISADHLFNMPSLRSMREWTSRHLYEPL